jgi:hypothetical protein
MLVEKSQGDKCTKYGKLNTTIRRKVNIKKIGMK